MRGGRWLTGRLVRISPDQRITLLTLVELVTLRMRHPVLNGSSRSARSSLSTCCPLPLALACLVISVHCYLAIVFLHAVMSSRKATKSRLPTTVPSTPTPARTRLPRPSGGRPALGEVANTAISMSAPATPSGYKPKPTTPRTPKTKLPTPKTKPRHGTLSPVKVSVPSTPAPIRTPQKASSQQKENSPSIPSRPAVKTPVRRPSRSSHVRRTSLPKSPASVFRRASLNTQFVFPPPASNKQRAAVPAPGPTGTSAVKPRHVPSRHPARRLTSFEITSFSSLALPDAVVPRARSSLMLPTPSFLSLRDSGSVASFALRPRLLPNSSTLSLSAALSRKAHKKHAAPRGRSSLLLTTPSYAALGSHRDASGIVLSPTPGHAAHRSDRKQYEFSMRSVNLAQDVFSASIPSHNRPLTQASSVGLAAESGPTPTASSCLASETREHDQAHTSREQSSAREHQGDPITTSGTMGLPEDMLKVLGHLEGLAAVVRDLKDPEPLTAPSRTTAAGSGDEDGQEQSSRAAVLSTSQLGSGQLDNLPAPQPPVAHEQNAQSRLPRLRRMSLALSRARPHTIVSVPLPLPPLVQAPTRGTATPLTRRAVSERGSPTVTSSLNSAPTTTSLARSTFRAVLRPRRSEPQSRVSPSASGSSPHKSLSRGRRIAKWARKSEGRSE